MTTPDAVPGPAAAWLADHAGEVAALTASLHARSDVLDRWGAHLAVVLTGGGRLLAAGNGGSAAEAQHLTAELVGRFVAERPPFSAIALHAETSATTAISNDYGAAEVFARQVSAHGRPGDVLVLLSTSGRSENVLRAAAAGRAAGMVVWALTGPSPNPLAAVADDALCLPGPSTSAVQEGHLVALHALCTAVDAHVLPAAPLGGPPVVVDVRGGAVPVTTTAAGPAPITPLAPVAPITPFKPVKPVAPALDEIRPTRPQRRRRRIVVIGDAVLDRDLVGRSERLAPDAPVPVVDVTGVLESPGGAALTAQLVATGDADVTLVAPLSDDEPGRRLRACLASGPSPVRVIALGQAGSTRTKTRVRVSGQSLLRLDDGGPAAPLDVDARALHAALFEADVVLVSDYGAGTTRDTTVRSVLTRVAAGRPVVWDPHPRGGPPVAGCALVTPNLAEARAASSVVSPVASSVVSSDVSSDGASGDGPLKGADALAAALSTLWRVGSVVVTTGAQGAWLGTSCGEPLFVPAPLASGGDPCGAGDRFAASAALALAGGAVPSEAVVTAVADASAWVAAGGAAGWREASEATDPDDAGANGSAGADALARLRARGGTLVATGGCFDVLHAGHVACLEAARRLGDGLVVLLNSDASVRRIKGPGRPVSGQDDRARVLAALDCVDEVVVFDEDDPRAALADLRPDVWAKGGDYGGAELPEAPLVRSWGGRVVLLPYLDGRSTTAILARGATGAPADPSPEPIREIP